MHSIIRQGLELAHLQGEAYGLLDDESQPVDGNYEVSTISVNGRRETVAFKRSGVGPEQIQEPYRIKTLTVSEAIPTFRLRSL